MMKERLAFEHRPHEAQVFDSMRWAGQITTRRPDGVFSVGVVVSAGTTVAIGMPVFASRSACDRLFPDRLTVKWRSNLVDIRIVHFVYFSVELFAYVGRDRKSTRLNSSHLKLSRMPSSA